MICFCYFLFVVPMALVNMVDDNADYPRVHLSLFCLYWLQYSLNFVVYAARGEQYRKAYSYFLKRVSIMFQCCTHTIHIRGAGRYEKLVVTGAGPAWVA